MVGGFLLIEGTEETLEPFRGTHGTLLVDSAEAYLRRLGGSTRGGGGGGVEILHPLQKVPTGAWFTARHPDGTVVEYVEHRLTEQGR
ncbi:hypothetical protein [Streptomyces sp. ISL-100]|uniref:hypothetical protein n=1 Tax=Streptomyces sp. ISL-100 TaxID=2819173 RepID=UPI001BE9938E|nr:hypothetical protein [Streptomyces sp. ISL-100]MBT2395687.1 hypothetical protein [Streptomyces sp. ISL-100]